MDARTLIYGASYGFGTQLNLATPGTPLSGR
jgi:hypothetical protein